MNCDDALIHALSAGPLPVEAVEHLRSCPRCASELEGLRALERTLAASAPAPGPSDALAAAVMARLGLPRQLGRAWLSAAAALFLALGLAAAWLGRGAQVAPVPAMAPPEPAAFRTMDEDTTAGLLQAYEPLAADLPQVQPEELSPYLAPADQGGWNG